MEAAVAPDRAALSRQLSLTVALQLRDRILTGELAAGTFLRSAHIAADYGVSATPVREAFFLLTEDGFLERHPRRGFVVRSISAQDISDMFWLQATISGELAARAIASFTHDDLARLREAQRRFEAAVSADDLDRITAANREFHVSINSVARAPKLRYVSAIAARYTPQELFDADGPFLDEAVSEHALIEKAFVDRDDELARRAMVDHVMSAGRRAVELFETGERLRSQQT